MTWWACISCSRCGRDDYFWEPIVHRVGTALAIEDAGLPHDSRGLYPGASIGIEVFRMPDQGWVQPPVSSWAATHAESRHRSTTYTDSFSRLTSSIYISVAVADTSSRGGSGALQALICKTRDSELSHFLDLASVHDEVVCLQSYELVALRASKFDEIFVEAGSCEGQICQKPRRLAEVPAPMASGKPAPPTLRPASLWHFPLTAASSRIPSRDPPAENSNTPARSQSSTARRP